MAIGHDLRGEAFVLRVIIKRKIMSALFTDEDLRPTEIIKPIEDKIYKPHYDIASVSYGKDSSVMVDCMLKDGRNIDFILFADTLLELPPHV